MLGTVSVRTTSTAMWEVTAGEQGTDGCAKAVGSEKVDSEDEVRSTTSRAWRLLDAMLLAAPR